MLLVLGYLLWFAAIGLGFWRGGGPERIFAAILAAMFLLDKSGHLLLGNRPDLAVDLMHMVVDLAVFMAMGSVSLKARRYWPLWACSCQLISVFTHLGWALQTMLPAAVYHVVDIAPSYLIFLSVICGTITHRRRLAKRGADPSWKNF